MGKSIYKMILFFIMMTFINVRALETGNVNVLNRAVCDNVELAIANSDGTLTSVSCYSDYSSAKLAMDSNIEEDNLVILEKSGGKVSIIDAKYALVYLDHGDVNQNIYTNKNTVTELTYMNNASTYGGTDAAFLGLNYSNKAVKIKISGVVGWIKKSDNSSSNNYVIVPLAWVKSSNYYQVTNSDINHYYAKNIESANYSQSRYALGPKPSMLEVGKYYSYDGNYFYSDLKTMLSDYLNNNYDHSVNKDEPYYNYYMYLPHRSRTNYTIDDLDAYLRHVLNFKGSIYGKKLISGYSVLYGSSEYYMKAEELYGANAISVFGLSRNESANGRSSIAINKNNVFGHNAVDGMAYDKATGYLDVRSSIYSHAYSYINYGYSEVADSRYHGGHFGNKLTGMNVSYASDVFWGEKAASYYYSFDKDNGLLDYDYYQLVISKGSKVNARSLPNTSSSIPFVIPTSGIPFILVEEVEGQVVNGSKIWYKLQSDSNITNTGAIIKSNSGTMPEYNWDGYVYVHSSYFTKINVGKTLDGLYNRPSMTKKDKVDDYDYVAYTDQKNYLPKVGLLESDTPYYYSITEINQKGVLKKGSYVTILMEATKNEETNYLVITDYSTFQKHWINGKDVKLVKKDLLKVSLKTSGSYIKIYDNPNGSVVFNVYDGNQLVITDTVDVNNKTFLKVQYKNDGQILYGYVDGSIDNISYTLNNLNHAPVITASNVTLMVNDEYDLLSYVKGNDEEDGDITAKITFDHNIDISKPGTYKVTYHLTDSFGETVHKEVLVYVKNREIKNGLFMYNELKHVGENKFIVSGFLGVKGMDNKEVRHRLIFVNQLTNEEYAFNLDNWQEYPYEMSSLDDVEAYDYSGGWFKSTIDLSSNKILNGDYTIYVQVINENYEAKCLFTNIAYMDMTRRAVGNNREFLIEVDYSTLNSPLLFSIRDKLLSTNVPKTVDPMYNFFNVISLNDSKLTLKGTSHNIGISYGINDDVKRQIVLENQLTFERYSFDLGSITNGDYPITLPVSDNCDKTKAWYNNTIELNSLPVGTYTIYIVNEVNNNKLYGELIDIAYTDFSKINNAKYQLRRNDEQRLRLELTIK